MLRPANSVYSNFLAFEIPDCAYSLVSEQFVTTKVLARQGDDRIAGFDSSENVSRRKGHDIHRTRRKGALAPDCYVELDVLNIVEALGPKKRFGNKLGSNADGRGGQESDPRRFGRRLRKRFASPPQH